MMNPQPAAPSASDMKSLATAGTGTPSAPPGQLAPSGGEAPGEAPPGAGGGPKISPQQIQELKAALTPSNQQALSLIVGAMMQDVFTLISQAGQQQNASPQAGGQVPAGPASSRPQAKPSAPPPGPLGPAPGGPPSGGIMSPTGL